MKCIGKRAGLLGRVLEAKRSGAVERGQDEQHCFWDSDRIDGSRSKPPWRANGGSNGLMGAGASEIISTSLVRAPRRRYGSGRLRGGARGDVPTGGHVVVFDAEGHPPWSNADADADREGYGGSRATATAGAPYDTLLPDQRAMVDRLSQPLTKTRVGKPMPGVLLIVGTWRYTDATGATAYERFTSDGEMVSLMEMQGREGTYVVRPDG